MSYQSKISQSLMKNTASGVRCVIALVALLSASCEATALVGEKPPVTQPKISWDAIEARSLPEGYHGSRHQEFVDGVMEKMKSGQRAWVGQLWKEKEQADPGMSNRGASFVRILMFVAEGEKSDALPAKAETPKKAWFRQPDARDQPVVKAPLPAGSRRKPGHPMFLSPQSDPIALHAGRLFVVNTPAATLDIIDPFMTPL